jgi:hypothetical protein
MCHAAPQHTDNDLLPLGYQPELARCRAANILQSLTFGFGFHESLQCVMMPRNMETLTFGDCYHQNLVTFGRGFFQSLECHFDQRD